MLAMTFFIAGSILLILISIPSLRHPGSHGFYRFFAWEAILGMFVLNVPHWFVHPFSWHQVISWILLLFSLILLISGFHQLKHSGKPTDSLEATTQLVQSGIYRIIRHPLYASLLFLSWGIFFKLPGVLVGCLASITAVFLYATAIADETGCLEKFGVQYSLYMKSTKMFIPFLF
jgi:protein-S-isoprenylcysteine O-methyltransferase Ste14